MSMWVVAYSPDDQSQVDTLTPELNAYGYNTGIGSGSVEYQYKICQLLDNGTLGTCTLSGWRSWISPAWTVPAGKLAWGKRYVWEVTVRDTGTQETGTLSDLTFVTGVRQPLAGSHLADRGVNGQEFHQLAGNYTTTFTDASVSTSGPPLSVTRSYNSLDSRVDGMFGPGWSTRFDMRIQPEGGTPQTLLVTYPDGRKLRFAEKPGTAGSPVFFQPPPGVHVTLATAEGGGWRLMDKSSFSYTFDAQGRLTKLTDKRGRAQDLLYDAGGKLTKVTAAGGRSLTFTWTGEHVTAVATDPVNGQPLTWSYAYDGQRLSQVCSPTAAPNCTVYDYATGSRYRASVLDDRPLGYWRMGEVRSGNDPEGGPYTCFPDETGQSGCAYFKTGVQSGRPGALTGTTNASANFQGSGTSSGIQHWGLFPKMGKSVSVESWFKTSDSGFIFWSGGFNTWTPSSSFNGVPGLYVGVDGKLRGQLRASFEGAPYTPVTSPQAVNDGQWHHAVITSTGGVTKLYVDGAAAGSANVGVEYSEWMASTVIGSGSTDSRLPGSPAGRSNPAEFGFKGLIDEVAVYDRALTAAQVSAHYAARAEAPFKLNKITLPSGRVWMSNTYNPANDRVATHVDQHGGTWKLGEPVHADTGGLTTVTVTDPNNNTLGYTHDARRGYRPVSRTDQLLKVTKYEYDTGGFLAKVTDPNNNVTEQVNDARGNVTAVKTCREATNCQPTRQTFYRNTADEFDPRNDQLTVSRDARSAGATDNTYATTTEYTTLGDVAKVTTPATSDFPSGRSATFTYTDGTEPAVGGGTTPAGLRKSAKDSKDNETTYRYTAAGDLAEQTSPSGLKIQFAHDALGRVTSRTEISQAHPDGVVTTSTYDGLGRVLTHTGAGVKNEITNVTHTRQTRYAYDTDGNKLTETAVDLTGGDPDRKISYTYNSAGRVETVTGPEGAVASVTWNTDGTRASITDEKGTVYTYAYTKRGELASTTIKNWTGSPVAPQAAQDVVLESFSYDPAGRLAGEADAMGRKTSYTYFTNNRLSEVIGDDVRLNGSTTTTDVVLEANTYDAAGNLTKQVTGGGKATEDHVYDAAGRLTSTTFDPATLKRKTAYTYDAVGNVTKEDFTGAGSTRVESTLYAYNALGQVTRQTVENGADDLVSTWSYDDRGLVTEATDPRGNASGATPADFTTTMRYDLAGQLVEEKSPQVKIDKAGSATNERPTVRYGYDSAGLLTQNVDAEGRAVTSTFDRASRLTSTTLPSYTPPGGSSLTPKVSYGYDAAGQMTSFTDQRGHVTSAEYDALGRQVRVTDPGPSGPGGTWVSEYDLLGEPLAVIDPTGARREATYDDLGRRITNTQIERRPTTAAHTTTLTYDTAGNLTKSVAPGNKTTSYTVNAAGQVTAITDPLNKTSAIGYDFLGRTAKVTDPLGNATEATYDLAGRKTAAKDLSRTGSTESVVRTFGFGYDPAGNPTSTTSAEGHVTQRQFDALGRMTALIEPVSASKSITSTFGYDATGARTRTTDGRGNATWTSYNTLGLVESVIEPPTTTHPGAADRTWTTIYDAAGNAVSTLQPGGVRIDRQFDPLGQMVKETGSGASVATPERNVTYDQAGRVTAIGDYTLEYNDRSLLTKASKATNQIAAYTYDALGNPTQRIDATGTANYTWDNASQLKTAGDPVTGRTWTYGYDDAGRLTTKTSASPVNTQTYVYDAVDRPTSQTLKNSSGTELSKIVYEWDKDDNLTTKTTTGTAGAGTNTYGYDHAGRLTSWTAPGGATTAYEWDDSGNRTKAGDKTFVYDERNRLTSGAGTDYTYTPRGTVASETKAGVTRNLTFDAFDRLISDGDASYGYDALGRMTSRTKGTEQQRFTYSGLENDIVAVADGAGSTLAKYGRDPFGGLLSLQEGAGPALGTMTDLHGDVVGTFSGTALVDSAAYDPFGEVTHRSGTQRTLGYQGEYTDPDTGKVNMHARWYQPGTGTFASRDDWTLEPSPSIQANRYTYGNGSPLVHIDPSGHFPLCLWPWHPLCPHVTFHKNPPKPPGKATASGTAGGAPVGNSATSTTGSTPRGKASATSTTGSTSRGKASATSTTGSAPRGSNPCYSCGSGPAPKPKPKPVEPPYKPDFDPNSKDFINDPNNATKDRNPPTPDELHCNYGRERPENFGGCTGGIDIIGGGGGGNGGGGIPCEQWNPGNCGEPSSVKPVGYTPSDSPTTLIYPQEPPSTLQNLADGCSGTFLCDFFIGDALNCAANPSLGSCAMGVIGFIPGGKVAATAAKLGSKLAKGAKGAAKACRRHSFIAGTLVLMADGTQKPIEDVKVGEYVLATDPETGRTEARAVTVLISGEGTKNLVKITVDIDGSRGNTTAPITATDIHPFWVPSLREWVDASELQPGMWLQTSAGTHVQITAIKKWTAPQRVHNLTVDDIHTYHVLAGNQAVLVHNCNRHPDHRSRLEFTDTERQKVYDENAAKNGGNYKCEYCGRDVERRPSRLPDGTPVPGRPDDAQIDHRIPRASGGCGSAHNGCVACRTCNRDKSTKSLEEWDDELRDFLD
ncbi:polymorphic toxin-type HINT domain-containing protein [Streptosporangium sp. NPDC006013]|uniref:polymorphic toxin-type HINT domain-containing protein n=1 Tax=Streptosporangium sp. NPDC006013 TaxID=3155596 RepID=UPI0033A8DCA2